MHNHPPYDGTYYIQLLMVGIKDLSTFLPLNSDAINMLVLNLLVFLFCDNLSPKR